MTTPESVETWLKEEAMQGEIVIHEKDGAEEKIARTDVISEVNLDTEPASLISEEEESTEDLADERCAYVSENGIRCRNHARPGSRFCGIHEQA